MPGPRMVAYSRARLGEGGRCGFTLVELLLVIAIIALLISILMPVLAEGRRTSWQAQNISNLRNFGTAAGSYAATYRDRIWSFSWRMDSPMPTRLLVNRRLMFTNDVDAAAWQAIDIIRRRATPAQPNFPDQGAWIPHVLYAHLVLQDFLASRLPEPMVRSPFDVVRKHWAEEVGKRTLREIAEVHGLPGNPASTGQRWPYSSSYQQTPACYKPDVENSVSFLRQGESDGVYEFSISKTFRLGDRRHTEVHFPSSKVMVMEGFSRHFGKQPYFFAHPYARTTNTFFDGSVRVVANPDFNTGGYLMRHGVQISITSATVSYFSNQAIGHPLWPDSSPHEGLHGRQRWTMGGLRGLDTGGKQLYGDPTGRVAVPR